MHRMLPSSLTLNDLPCQILGIDGKFSCRGAWRTHIAHEMNQIHCGNQSGCKSKGWQRCFRGSMKLIGKYHLDHTSNGKTCNRIRHILHSLLTLHSMPISSHGFALLRCLFFDKSFQKLFCFLAVEPTKKLPALEEVEKSVTLGGDYVLKLDTIIDKGSRTHTSFQ